VRQVSFTLLMTGRCDSNPAQYERNRRFGHLVHALARAGGGAKLPSVGLCLNASKAVSFLGIVGNDTSRSSESRKAQKHVTLLGDRRSRRSSHEPVLPFGSTGSRRDLSRYATQDQNGRTSVFLGSMLELGIVCRRLTYLAGCCTSVEQFPRCDLLRLRP
jgi:hypothetical protein